VAIEASIKDHTLFLFGEITSRAHINAPEIAKDILARIGYDDPEWGLSLDRLKTIEAISRPSAEIAFGVDGHETGAGDQGIMFGYACSETPELMPLPIMLAHQLMRVHHNLRRSENGSGLGPDAKAQVTVLYENGLPREVTDVVLSTQHCHGLGLGALRELIVEAVIKPTLDDLWRPNVRLHINPAGTFHLGGPAADAGLTGRKIIVDTYGGSARHGGGAFSGKDATKVDRSAAYAARQLAKDVVSRGWADSCEVQVSYAIGEARPVSFAFLPTGGAQGHEIAKRYQLEGIDLYGLFEPARITERLQLRLPSYLRTAAFGHFGRDDVSWEKPLDRSQQQRDHVRELAIREQVGRMGFVSGLALDQVKKKRAEDYAKARDEFMASHL
jgi:S-adenosylmethionine synthetase